MKSLLTIFILVSCFAQAHAGDITFTDVAQPVTLTITRVLTSDYQEFVSDASVSGGGEIYRKSDGTFGFYERQFDPKKDCFNEYCAFDANSNLRFHINAALGGNVYYWYTTASGVDRPTTLISGDDLQNLEMSLQTVVKNPKCTVTLTINAKGHLKKIAPSCDPLN